MTNIKIFIASSYELSEQRVLIGDYIRRLSYDYSPRGIRVRMLCWEDFYPEYTGKSKQQEYDEQLIKTCDIFIAMFRARCGKYTQHEVHYALEQNKECHILQLPTTESHDELDGFLAETNLTVCQCCDRELLSHINEIINVYIQNHHLTLSSNAMPVNSWRLYTTIPNDCTEIRVPFSNMIRGLESNLDETLNCYFTLHPYRTMDNIASTDHYICFMKDKWNNEDEEEVISAYSNCKDVNMPESTILYQFEGHTGEESNELAIRINTEYQGFSKTFSHIDTVKSDLLMWAMRHKMPIASHTSKLFKVEEDYIYFCDRPFFQLKMYKELHDTIVLLADEIKKIDIKIKRNTKNGRVKNEELAITLANKRSQKELSIHNAVANWYNKIQLQQSSKSIWAELQTEKVKAGAFSNFQELAKSVNILTEQCEKGVNKQQLNNLSSMLQKWESVAEICLSFCEIQVKEYIKALICIVQICDTYLHPFEINYDEDAVFKKIIDASDQYDYHTLFTEVMRVNYANSFGRNLDYKSAGDLYEEAYKQISQIEDDSVIAHHYKSYVIHSLLHYYADTDNKQKTFELGQIFEQTILQWQKLNPHTSYDVELAQCYSCVLAAAPKNYGVCAELVKRAETLLAALHQTYDNRPFDDNYYDAICHFSVVLSTYYIDRYRKGDDTYYKKGLRYIKESLDGLFARYPYDPEYIEHSLSQPFHNRAFLYAKNGEWDKAISNYKSALKKRRIVYEKYLDDKDLFEVAQTCVNIGDAYRIAKKFNKALEYAEEALDIYSSKRNENQEVFEMYYYEAYQLKATILMDIDVSNGKVPDIPLSMMEECMKWSNSHPTNDYADRFNGVSGIILQSYKHKKK